MKYLLDTCVISDFIKGEANTLRRMKDTSPSDLTVSTITVMEIQYGLALNPKLAKEINPIISDFLSQVDILNFTRDDALQASIIRATLKQQGCPVGPYDILLAGTALNYKLIFVTSNVSEFNRISGIRLENWRTKV